MSSLVSGTGNIAIGAGAGSSYTSETKSDNIVLFDPGATGDTGVIRIGTETGPNTQTQTFIAGIFGSVVSDPANQQAVVVDETGNLVARLRFPA